MRLAGLDSALRKSGAAVMDGDRFLHAEAFTARGKSHGEAFHEFRTWWRGFLLSNEVERAAVEEPLRSDLTKTNAALVDGAVIKTKVPITTMKILLGLYGVRAHAIEVCAGLNIPVVEVNNQEWRDVIHGQRRAPKGTTNSSEWWKSKAMERCAQLGWSVPSKDAAEAALIAEWLRISLSPMGRAKHGDLFATAS
jgi:hypothetical protein